MILTHFDLETRSRSSTWYALVDPKQGYDIAKFEKENNNNKKVVRTVSVKKKPAVTFLSNKERRQLSLLNMSESQKQWYIHDKRDVLNKLTKYQLNRIRT